MNYLDIGLLVMLAVALFTGLRRGLIKGVFSLGGVILGIVLASRFYTAFSDSTVGQIITFVAIFVVVAWVASLIGSMVRKVAKMVMLGWVDNILGAVLGLAIGVISIGAALAAYLSFFGTNSLIADSLVGQILLEQFPVVLGLLPDRFQDLIRPYLQY
ncbi:CvpA family protein [Chloroflexota bacterium]